MKAISNSPIIDGTTKIREEFHGLLAKANKEHPNPADVKALSDLLYKNKDLKLWGAVLGMGALAEHTALENALGDRAQGSRQCWKHRLEFLRKDLGYETASPLERLLIQQVSLCWLNLNMVEFTHSNLMHQSITLTHGIYWEKRLSAAQRRFTRACETLARVRKLSRNTPALQFNIAASGGQQVNLTK